jgi:hypothetical protein
MEPVLLWSKTVVHYPGFIQTGIDRGRWHN